MKPLLLLIFWSLWFLNFSSRAVLSPLLPIIEEELALSHAMAGSFFLFISIGYTISLILGGLVSPRFGHKRTMAASFLFVSVVLFCLRLADSYQSLTFLMLLVGISTGIYLPSVVPMITAIFDRQKWGRVFALHDSGASFSIFAIPALVAVALRFFYWRTLFLILGGACLVGLTAFWLISPQPRVQKEEGVRFLHILARRDLWVLVILWSFASAASMGVYNVIPLFLVEERGIPLELANTIFGISRVGGLFVVPLAGFLADRYGAKRMLLLIVLVTGIATTGLALAQDFNLLVVMLILQATASGGFFPVGLLSISKLTDSRERSTFTGSTIAFGVATAGFIPLVLGAVADVWNFQLGILVLGILMVCSTVSLRGLKRI